jgi:protein-S-isoprenylcysteine O-methyltransferase Ste14
MAGVLFAVAGSVHWAQGWTFVALWFIATALPHVALARENPDLLKRRALRHAEYRRYERVLRALMLPLLLAIPAVAAAEHRLGWSDLPPELVYGGTLLVLFGAVARAWAMMENKHYEPAMRIQRDIGHKVVYNGPYRIIRHPGYLAASVQVAGAPLVLCSLWAWVPVAGIVVLWFVRAFIEDRVLQEELKGYIAYSRQVPTILIPGVW